MSRDCYCFRMGIDTAFKVSATAILGSLAIGHLAPYLPAGLVPLVPVALLAPLAARQAIKEYALRREIRREVRAVIKAVELA